MAEKPSSSLKLANVDSPIKSLPENTEAQQLRQVEPATATVIANVIAPEKATEESAAVVVSNRFNVLETINEIEVEETYVEPVLEVKKMAEIITESEIATRVATGTEVATGQCALPDAEIVEPETIMAETDFDVLIATSIDTLMEEMILENFSSLSKGIEEP
ncbi:OLC1v1036385C1 [Oldenlandia corymbosa var. corymbosa]|uniref:OLC1v1036385C1 n=1 Tax=Oldenlandia corymbosa var. corymbosa TaxID=529605 RepID=A0AAV1CVW2_OLDCO|nr:OLC1v1036385C1 [Oldenlandia corymbosa var. corymbosa]